MLYVHTYIGVPLSDTHALDQMMGQAGLTARLRNDVAPTVMAERVRRRWAELTASPKTRLRRGGGR